MNLIRFIVQEEDQTMKIRKFCVNEFFTYESILI